MLGLSWAVARVGSRALDAVNLVLAVAAADEISDRSRDITNRAGLRHMRLDADDRWQARDRKRIATALALSLLFTVRGAKNG
jgi:hypothetical protein